MLTFSFAEKTAVLRVPEGDVRRVIYLIGEEDAAKTFVLPHTAVALVNCVDWNRDLSPWSAERVFRRGEDFAGGADGFLQELTEGLLPKVDAKLGSLPRAVAGYSLAGLFAVWALYRTDAFDRAASMSGSLWFDGFAEFAEENVPVRMPEKVYFSLGEREKKTKNARMAQVEVCTARVAEIFRGYGADVRYILHPGGHFDDVPERITQGLTWICKE